MEEIWWSLNGKQFTLAHLKKGDFQGRLSELERSALHFGHAWTTGAKQFILKTSGSTGVPKEIVIHRHQMEASARLTEKALGLRRGYTALLCLDTRRIAGQMMLVRSLVTGMNLLGVEPVANPMLAIPDSVSIDFAAMVPYQMQAIFHDPPSTEKLNKLKTVILGGAPVEERMKFQITQLKCQAYATYGMTETISHVALQKLNGAGAKDCFQVLEGVSIESDERGCLVLRAGYLGPDRIITNDLVDIISPLEFRWLGRVDHVINSGGVKVIPEKIEKEVGRIFHSLGLLNRFFVSGMPDSKLGSKVVLIVEGSSPGSDLTQLIMKSLGAVLPPYEVPREIDAVPQFVETATQKINRKETMKELKVKS